MPPHVRALRRLPCPRHWIGLLVTLALGLLVAPAAVPTATPTKDTIAVTVRLDPELSLRLKRHGVSFRPRKTNQDVIVAAIERYLAQAKG